MTLQPKTSETIESWSGLKIMSKSAINGGCIGNALKIKLSDEKTYFLKQYSPNSPVPHKEANGLRELAKANAIRAPSIQLECSSFILLDYINPGHTHPEFFAQFGRELAQLHRHRGDHFGFYEDNFIGSTPQQNISHKSESIDWCEFYWNKRLLPQYKLAERNGYVTPELKSNFLKLEEKLYNILSDSKEEPSLLHGDLWNGNFIADCEGNAWIIDPAVYYGHREADLAMTKLFGGFSNEFYEAYNKAYPLKPGHEYREGIYTLYHVMNHLNLFGHSYYPQAISLLRRYL